MVVRKFKLPKKSSVVEKIKDYSGKFVDPENVNSTVRYSFMTELFDDGRVEFEGDVHFGDCSRVISWSGGYNDPDGGRGSLLKKVDGAIKALKEARGCLIRHGIISDDFKAEFEQTKKQRKRK